MGKYISFPLGTQYLALVGVETIENAKVTKFINTGDDDATDSQCQIQSVPNILVGNILNHVRTLSS